MNILGIELRQANTLPGLYQDVDLVLQSIHFPEVQRQAVAHSLTKMLRSPFFDICVVDACSQVHNLIIPRDRYNIYQSVHCVYWRDMNPDFRTQLIALLLDDFREILNPTNEETKGKAVVVR